MSKIATDDLRRVTKLYHQGKYLQAFRASQPLGAPESWQGTLPRVWAGRLVNNLGAPRLGRVLHQLAWRADPENPEARYFYVLALISRRDTLSVWRVARGFGDLPGADESRRADWFALISHILATLRDFESADRWFGRAEQLRPDRAWIWVERSAALSMQDQPEQSLEAARRALRCQPWFRPAVQATSQALVQLGRDDEALDLLHRAMEKIESGHVLAQLALLQSELGQYEQSRESYERLAVYFPLAGREKTLGKWLASRRADAAYYCGDYARAIELAEPLDDKFHKQVIQRLKQNSGQGKRVFLPVGYVRQHHVTCAPATLTSISGFWSKPADHLEVAEQICYDGTPAHSERAWAESNGWVAREFTVTWDSAVALLDRGAPFTLTTVAPGMAHLQAVIGYDSRRGTLLTRDPSHRLFGEVLGEELLESLRSTGPRGMALAPAENAALLDGLELPEAELFDRYHELQRALERHARSEAQSAYDSLLALAPSHRLTINGRLALSRYDADLVTSLECLEALLEQFPDDGNLQLARLSCLRELGHREQRLELLRELCEKSESDPLFWLQYAQELSDDARRHAEAQRLARRAFRFRPDGRSLIVLANIAWDGMRREEALELYRFAACLDERDEDNASAYFAASRHFRRTDETVRFLRDRFERFGKKSNWPARTLCRALDQLGRSRDALAALEEALRRRPDDGDLQLFAAQWLARYGQAERASRMLTAARKNSHANQWLRTAALLASNLGDVTQALEHWRSVLELEPLAYDANECVAQLLADTAGAEHAQRFLRDVVQRFPNHYSLRVLYIEWLRREDPAEAEAAVRAMLTLHSGDPWAHRELALLLIRQGKLDEAAAHGETAVALDPTHPAVFMIRARLSQHRGQVEAAKEHYRAAIRLSVDFEQAIAGLIEACDTKAERKRELRFIQSELERQVIFGDALATYREYAAETLKPDELLRSLKECLDERPDLWSAWSALIRQLVYMDRLKDAAKVAERGTKRFPLNPSLWLDVAAARRAADAAAGEIRAIQRALRISPNWSNAARMLSEAYERQGDFAKSCETLQKAVARDAGNAQNHGCLADALWHLERKEEALDEIRLAARLEPRYDWAWDRLREWSAELDQPQVPVELAKQCAQSRPNDAGSWIRLAGMLDAPDDRQEGLAAVDRALALDPRNLEAHGKRVYLLSSDERWEEALAACRPPVFGEAPPLELRARAAGIEAQRGDLTLAIERMRQVLADDSNFYWGWSRVADWTEQTGDDAAYLQAAENMVRIQPQEALSWGYRGDARQRTGDRPGAKHDLQRAAQLTPSYVFAGMSLFRMCLEDDELVEAQAALDKVATHIPDDYVLSERIRLDSLRLDEAAARRHLQSLCLMPAGERESLDIAVDIMRDKGWDQALEEVLGASLKHDGVNPEIAGIWIGLCVSWNQWERAEQCVNALRDREALWTPACDTYLRKLGSSYLRKQGSSWHLPALRAFLDDNTQRLQRHAYAWAAAGAALHMVDWHEDAIRWFSNWRQRGDVEAWMLLPAIDSLWRLEREDEGARLAQEARELPADYSHPLHAIWLSINAILRGDTDTATNWLALAPPDAMESQMDFYQALGMLTCILVELQREPNTALRHAKRRVRQALSEYAEAIDDDSLLRQLYFRGLWRLAADRHRPLSALWWKLRAKWFHGKTGLK